jgi:8-oxo-dGTP pyrophosphatase MutT (NUDIX family)
MNDETLKKKVQVVIIAEESLLLFEFNNQIPNNYVGFQNITGSVEGDESFVEAAVRELGEEAGIDSPVIEINKEFSFFDRWKKHCVEKVYLCHLNKKPHIVLNEEHIFCKWIPMNDVVISDFTFPTNFEAFEACRNYVREKKQ